VNSNDEAVEAARAAYLAYPMTRSVNSSKDAFRAALEAAAPHMLIHVHHHDIEHHARSFNEGYEAAVTQGLADVPTLADVLFLDMIRVAIAEALDVGMLACHDDMIGKQSSNPYRTQTQTERQA
jgi:hypothetical protein